MSEKVQKIKQEIERIEQILDDFNKTHNNTIDNGIVSAKKNICKHIKSFINSLPEEPDWQSFRNKVAGDILCAMVPKSNNIISPGIVEYSIMIADELIKQLKEKDVETIDKKQCNQELIPKYKIGDSIEYRGEMYKITNVTVTDNNFYYDVSLIKEPSDLEEVVTSIGMAAEEQMFKIEQNLILSEEDEKIRKALIENFSNMAMFSNWGAINKIQVSDIIAWLEKQGKKEHIDESKPKFNVGDWITNGEYTWKVTDIKPLDYILQSQNGEVVDDTISYVDEEFHLWTIEDAKDGDVLSDKNPFIFRGFGDKEHPNSPTAYCGINLSGTFILSEEDDWWTADNVYPATKEQRDLLFKKMKKAGYEWDAEKKELKKIEQNPSWSEEDNIRL